MFIYIGYDNIPVVGQDKCGYPTWWHDLVEEVNIYKSLIILKNNFFYIFSLIINKKKSYLLSI